MTLRYLRPDHGDGASVTADVARPFPPRCCGQDMYRCNADHTDGKSYYHCHSCWRNVEDAS